MSSSAGCWSQSCASLIYKKSGTFKIVSRLNLTAQRKTASSSSLMARMWSALVMISGSLSIPYVPRRAAHADPRYVTVHFAYAGQFLQPFMCPLLLPAQCSGRPRLYPGKTESMDRAGHCRLRCPCPSHHQWIFGHIPGFVVLSCFLLSLRRAAVQLEFI